MEVDSDSEEGAWVKSGLGEMGREYRFIKKDLGLTGVRRGG